MSAVFGNMATPTLLGSMGNSVKTLLGNFGIEQQPALPFGIASDELYNPDALRKYKLRMGLMGAALGLLGQGGDRAPTSLQDQIGQGIGGYFKGSMQGEKEYADNALLGTKLKRDNETYQRQQEEYARETDQRQAKEAWLKSLPGPVQNMLRANPELAKDYIKATNPSFQTADSGGSAFGTPLGVTDANGNFTGWGLPTKSGGFIPLNPGQGSKFMSPYGKAYDTKAGGEAGKAQGEATAAYNSMASKMPGLENVVSQLDGLAEKATYTLAGQGVNAGRTQLGMEPSEGAVARTEYQAVVANQILPLLRDTFGAQFTAREGDVLMATLGDPNKTPTEKQAVLRAFIAQKRRDVEALAAQAGATNGGGAVTTPDGYTIEPMGP